MHGHVQSRDIVVTPFNPP